MDFDKGGRKSSQDGRGLRLSELGLTYNESSRYQLASRVPLVAARLMDYERAEAKKRKVEAGKAHGRGQKVVTKVTQPISDARAPAAREVAGVRVGCSGVLVDEACYIIEHGVPELVAMVECGDVAIGPIPIGDTRAKAIPREVRDV